MRRVLNSVVAKDTPVNQETSISQGLVWPNHVCPLWKAWFISRVPGKRSLWRAGACTWRSPRLGSARWPSPPVWGPRKRAHVLSFREQFLQVFKEWTFIPTCILLLCLPSGQLVRAGLCQETGISLTTNCITTRAFKLEPERSRLKASSIHWGGGGGCLSGFGVNRGLFSGFYLENEASRTFCFSVDFPKENK